MSLEVHRGAAWAFHQLMKQAQADIDRGERKGADRKWRTANPAKVGISWAKRRLLLGEFRKRA